MGITVVFGCGADRDKTKRPIMGNIASQYADKIIITSDNPRPEDPQTIIDEVAQGVGADTQVVQLIKRDEVLSMC